MTKRFALFLIFALSLVTSLSAQKVAVSGVMQGYDASAPSANASVRVELKGCGSNLPKINGTTILAPQVVDINSFSSAGGFNLNLYYNDLITCGGSTASNYYLFTFNASDGRLLTARYRFCQNASSVSCSSSAVNADLTAIIPLQQSPIVPLPVSPDSVYCRLDGTNGACAGFSGGSSSGVALDPTLDQTITGNWIFNDILNTKIQNGQFNAALYPGTDLGAQVNAAFADCGNACTVIIPVSACSTTWNTSIVMSTSTQRLVGPGSAACDLHYNGTGDGITFQLSFVQAEAGALRGLTIDGSANPNGSVVGLHTGNVNDSEVDDVVVTGFNQTGDIGIEVENLTGGSYNNNVWTRVIATNNTTDVALKAASGATAFNNNHFYSLHLDVNASQTGFTTLAGAGNVSMVGGDLIVDCNATGAVTACFNIANSGVLDNLRYNITGSGTVSATGITVASGAKMRGYGLVKFLQNLTVSDAVGASATGALRILANNLQASTDGGAITNFGGSGNPATLYPIALAGLDSPFGAYLLEGTGIESLGFVMANGTGNQTCFYTLAANAAPNTATSVACVDKNGNYIGSGSVTAGTGAFLASGAEGTAPGSPAAGQWEIYFKTSTGLCEKNSTGVETCFGAGAGSSGITTVSVGGSAFTQRPQINFISGTNATVSCADNAGATRTDCTVSAATQVGRQNIYFLATGATTWTPSMPATLTEFLSSSNGRQQFDFSPYSQFRLVLAVATGGATSAELRVQYSTDGGSTWSYLENGGGTTHAVNINVAGSPKTGSFVTIDPAAKADVQIRIVGINGDGNTTTPPVFRAIYLQVK